MTVEEKVRLCLERTNKEMVSEHVCLDAAYRNYDDCWYRSIIDKIKVLENKRDLLEWLLRDE